MEENLRILIMEDVPTDAELCERELRGAGLKFTAQRVDTRAAFERALNEFKPDLILSDFSMPTAFDGLAALDLVRGKDVDIPFVFVSGTIGEDRAVEAMKRGATDYVLKDRLKRLVPVIRRALQEAEGRSARRKAEEEIARQRAFLRQVIDLDRNLIFARDREGRFTLVNQALADFYGCPVEYPLGKTYADINPDPARAEQIRKVDLEVMDTLREVYIPEEQFTDAAGRVRWHQVVKRPLISADGKANMVLGIATDITERKRNEEALRESEYRLDLALEASDLAVWDWNLATGEVRFSRHWWPILGYQPDEIPLRVDAWEKLTHPDDLARVKSMLAATVKGSVPVLDVEYRMRAKSGEWRWIRTVGRVVERDTAGRALRKTGTHGDVTERKLQEQKIEKLSRIRAVSSGINAAIVRIRERESLLQETCRITSEQGNFEMVWIGALDPEKQEVRPVAWTGFSPEAAHAVSWASISAARGTLGEAIRTRKPAVRNDIGAELPASMLRQEALNKGCLSTVCLPLVVDDSVVALIALFAAGRGFFDADELALLNELAADVSFALQSISRQEKLNYLAYYDALTGLPNRTLFHERVTQLIHSSGPNGTGVAVAILDLERFRNINETLGVGVGDALLKQVAERLSHVIGEQDTVARISGDHFAVALGGVLGEAQIAHLLEQRILAVLNEPFPVAGHELRIPAKAGIAVYPSDGNEAAALFANAEAALSKAKQSGDRFLFYAPQMNARVAEQLKLENELRTAVMQEQFVLHYQPRVELGSGRISGLEALIRWAHPERGLVPPGEFIPILEGTGLILEAGRWALKRAALDHAAWRTAGLKPPRVAVNVSQIQLRRKDFVQDIRTALAAAGDSGEHVDIEITESMLMEDIEGNIAKLEAIKAMGMQIAMDDFGTGYSSLGYLAKLPINSLKIDRSFVSQMAQGPEQMAMVSTVISLARALNLKVVAEGVETEEQSNLLRLLRCDEAQGYLFHRPLPPAEIERLIT